MSLVGPDTRDALSRVLRRGPVRVVHLCILTAVAVIGLDALLAVVDRDGSSPFGGLVHAVALPFLAPFSALLGDRPALPVAVVAVLGYLALDAVLALALDRADGGGPPGTDAADGAG